MNIKDSKEYQDIKEFYGERKAQRSQVPLMNHIDEGLTIMEYKGASPLAMRAYCLHPIFQGDQEFFENQSRLKDYDLDVVLLVMEYRRAANAYLCRPHTDRWGIAEVKVQVGLISEDLHRMLVADKLQNRKDFEIHHLHSHPRSAELYRYFQMWCLLLGQEFKLINKGHRHLYNVETNYGTFEVTANNRTQAHSLVANYGMEALSINMVG